MTQTEQAWISQAIGPRSAGTIWYDNRYATHVKVLEIGIGNESKIGWSSWSITEVDCDANGEPTDRVRTHCTAWDSK